MCIEPATALAIASVASAASSVYGQQQAANAQSKANQRQYENTLQARAANINQTNLAQQQQREESMQKLEENSLAARAAAATARVSAGENGISGLSVDALLADIGTKQNRYESSVQTNYDRTSQAIANQRENIDINAASQINSLKTPAMPDYIGAGLKIAQAGYDYSQRK